MRAATRHDLLNLQHELIEKDITAGGADQMTLKLKPIQATHARDALIKQLYARIFDHLVFCINAALSMDVQYDSTIGLLDVSASKASNATPSSSSASTTPTSGCTRSSCIRFHA